MKQIIRTILINLAQALLNKAYNRSGLTDRILRDQIRINELRNKYDIPDKKQINEEGYVQ